MSCCRRVRVAASVVAGGVLGATKAVLGVDRVSFSEEERRRSSCLTCPALRYQMCTDCKCVVALKILVKAERCPRNRW